MDVFDWVGLYLFQAGRVSFPPLAGGSVSAGVSFFDDSAIGGVRDL
ncbi:MAG: hypothetical protein LBV77_02635 [Candidatus Adiutrix intracellularis]|nr:hypothetical protein [Candidatus Adiutrix intracellularis]